MLPIGVLLGSFLMAGVWHLALMIFSGANKPFEATYRVYCYVAGSCAWLGLIPFCGPFISFVWNLVAASIGLAKVHQIGTGKATTAVLLPLILCCGCCVTSLYFLWGSLAGNPEFMNAFNSALKKS
jgi:hypothetical protein